MKHLVLAIAVVLSGSLAWGETEEELQIRLPNGASSVFADSPMTWRAELMGTNALEGQMTWSLSLSGGVVARREQRMVLRPNEPVGVDIQAELPSVKEGVVVEGELKVALLDDQRRLRAEITHPVFLFGRNPAALRAEWIKDLDLHVFDSDGETATVLDELEWPYRLISNLSAFDTLDDAVLLIGEGCSLRARRGLMESAVRAARKGVRVVFLSFSEGTFMLSQITEESPRPVSLRFQDESFVRELDKRLDVPPVRGTFRIAGQRTGAEVVVEPAGGWACLEASWDNGGRLLITGCGLLDTWETSPAPRYLLVRILEWITTEKEREE